MAGGDGGGAGGASPLPPRAGIGLRAEHYQAMMARRPPEIGWLEVHSENYFCAGGLPHRVLETLAGDYPLSLHGVGLSLGSADPLDRDHLARLRQLAGRYQPAVVSEHLSWGAIGGRHFNDLLPLPYTEEALDHFCARLSAAQALLGRRLLIENVSSYLVYRHSTIPEWEFLAEVHRRTGCGLLLDVNNVYVNGVNHGFDPAVYLAALPREAVMEMHLAGYTVDHLNGRDVLIDTHNRPVAEPVWELYRQAVALLGPRPTLIEWDSELPALDELLAEAARAQAILDRSHALVA